MIVETATLRNQQEYARHDLLRGDFALCHDQKEIVEPPF